MANVNKEVKWEHKPLTGEHRVTPDGEYVFIGGHKFKRIVLPSHADLHKASRDETLVALEECDAISAQEVDTDEIEEG